MRQVPATQTMNAHLLLCNPDA